MPLELGLFLGCKRFGGRKHSRKTCVILDSEPYRYRDFISDIAGQDIRSHQNEPERAIVTVRNWLRSASRRRMLPGGAMIAGRYQRFLEDLPALCEAARLNQTDLTFLDLSAMISNWLKTSR
jgi:hypothetical protein